MSVWGWTPPRSEGIWRHGPLWIKPLSAAVPYVTLAVLLLTIHFMGGTLTSSGGILLELPEAGLGEGEATELVALVTRRGDDTLVFFDDARYTLGDPVSSGQFGSHLAERLQLAQKKTLLVLADRRIPTGELSHFATIARLGGVERLLLADKRGTGAAEGE